MFYTYMNTYKQYILKYMMW